MIRESGHHGTIYPLALQATMHKIQNSFLHIIQARHGRDFSRTHFCEVLKLQQLLYQYDMSKVWQNNQHFQKSRKSEDLHDRISY